MTKPSRSRAAGWLAAGALLTTALIAPATVSASSPTIDPHHNDGGSCTSSLFSWSVSNGSHAYPMLTVSVQAKGSVPEGCSFSFSLNSYTAQGPTWPTSGTQALYDHDSVTLSANNTSGTLTVDQPPCFGQTDFYTGTTKFDGQDGQLPHYPNVVTPTGLIAYSNGGAACEQPSSSPSEKPSSSPSSSPSDEPSQPVESESVPPSEQPSSSPSDEPSQPVESESVPPSASPSESPSDQPSESPSDQPSESPSDQPSESPSDQPSTSPSDQPSSSPSGSVEAETGTPAITPPPTDAATPSSGTTGSGWQLLLLASSVVIASLLVLTPAKRRR